MNFFLYYSSINNKFQPYFILLTIKTSKDNNKRRKNYKGHSNIHKKKHIRFRIFLKNVMSKILQVKKNEKSNSIIKETRP